jgi:hypothetical protein
MEISGVEILPGGSGSKAYISLRDMHSTTRKELAMLVIPKFNGIRSAKLDRLMFDKIELHEKSIPFTNLIIDHTKHVEGQFGVQSLPTLVLAPRGRRNPKPNRILKP